MVDEVQDLFEQHGFDPEATMNWARERAAQLLAESGGGDLQSVLEGVQSRATPADEPSAARPLPPLPNAARVAAEAAELEELDVDELEELDVDELELLEESEESEEPVRTGDTAVHTVVTESIVDEDAEEGDDDDPLGDDSIPIDLDDD